MSREERQDAKAQGRNDERRKGSRGDLVIVGCKATCQYNAIFEAQTLTDLRLTGLKPGLAINFGERVVKNGIHCVVNGL